MFPTDPTEMSAQIGGAIANNASGARSFIFGSIRNHVEWLKIVLANGETCTVHRGKTLNQNGSFTLQTDDGKHMEIPVMTVYNPATKNSSGYYSRPNMDLIDLFIGSEGTLGAIAEVGLRLTERKDFTTGLTFFPTRHDAFCFADFLRDHKNIASIEFFDQSAIDFINSKRDVNQIDVPDFPSGCNNAILWEHIGSGDTFWEETIIN
jgi:D-lactate dehydrogenase (cytochrome)